MIVQAECAKCHKYFETTYDKQCCYCQECAKQYNVYQCKMVAVPVEDER